MPESSSDLVGLSDYDLRMRAGDATHQHFKGGLYRYVGTVRDADTGQAILGKDGQPRIIYEHCYPHLRQSWIRDYSEWYGAIELDGKRISRFRKLG